MFAAPGLLCASLRMTEVVDAYCMMNKNARELFIMRVILI